MGKKKGSRGQKVAVVKKNTETKVTKEINKATETTEVVKTKEAKEANKAAEPREGKGTKDARGTKQTATEKMGTNDAEEVTATKGIKDAEQNEQASADERTKPVFAKKASKNVKQNVTKCHSGACEQLRDDLERFKLRSGRTDLVTKLKLVGDKSNELRRVLELLTQMDRKRQCFMFVGSLLVSRPVKEVLPVLQAQVYTSHTAICQLRATIKDVDQELMRLGDNPEHLGIW